MIQVVSEYLFELSSANHISVSLVEHFEACSRFQIRTTSFVPPVIDYRLQNVEIVASPFEELRVCSNQFIVLILDRYAIEPKIVDDALETLLTDKTNVVFIEELERVL